MECKAPYIHAPVLVRYCTGSDTSSAGIPVNLGPVIYPSSHVTFSIRRAFISSSVDSSIEASSLKRYYTPFKLAFTEFRVRLTLILSYRRVVKLN
ncbi:uncharacterized protein RCO7_14034 [Rhynchosporium graminicola]|uniref:Uncharacterized protein n=1 Tax=Rhynchosporium graminicola TaxID=2792576 RepID=A0A1E1KT20_9HELO|nr:uncharacterized protein RCO7_14034 [Rhynchosporium commune]